MCKWKIVELYLYSEKFQSPSGAFKAHSEYRYSSTIFHLHTLMLVYLLIKILISGMCCCGLTNRVNEKRDSVFNKWGADVPADSHWSPWTCSIHGLIYMKRSNVSLCDEQKTCMIVGLLQNHRYLIAFYSSKFLTQQDQFKVSFLSSIDVTNCRSWMTPRSFLRS